jgi:hypothetical protein
MTARESLIEAAETLASNLSLRALTASEQAAAVDTILHLASCARRLDEALRRVIEWPLPQGSVETYSLPPWLARDSREALGDA